MLTDAQRERFERDVRRAFGAANRGKAEEMLRLLGDPPDIGRVTDRFWRSIGDPLMADLEPILVEAAVNSANGVASRVAERFKFSWNMVNVRAERWAERYAFELVRGITDNSRDKLSRMVRQFITDGREDLTALGERAGTLFGSERGQRIATTEVTRAAAQGEQAIITEIRDANPALQVVQLWMTSRDEFVCPVCGPRHGQRRGQGWTELPPAHPNCRCAVATEFVGVDRA